jgi:hypothetical protein
MIEGEPITALTDRGTIYTIGRRMLSIDIQHMGGGGGVQAMVSTTPFLMSRQLLTRVQCANVYRRTPSVQRGTSVLVLSSLPGHPGLHRRTHVTRLSSSKHRKIAKEGASYSKTKKQPSMDIRIRQQPPSPKSTLILSDCNRFYKLKTSNLQETSFLSFLSFHHGQSVYSFTRS